MRSKIIKSYPYNWRQGRQLASMSNGATSWTYTYDADGMRIGRTNGTDTYTYVYNGSLLSQMTRNGRDMFFTYDAMGMPATLTYRGIVFFYVTNLQGDVMALMDEEGNIVVEYLYDAWGNLLSITGAMANTLGIWNPLTYRGYVYDHDTGLYYLQSRYYNPEIGRFLNADAYVSTGGSILDCNMYAYCGNNPVNHIDFTGCIWEPVMKLIQDFTNTIKRTIEQIMQKLMPYTENRYLNEKEMQHNATFIYNYLYAKGWSHNAICATLGNMQQESTINPGRHQVGGSAFGLVQWDPPTKYTNWAAKNGYAENSYIGQLEYLIYSMRSGNGEWFKNYKYPEYYLSSDKFKCSNDSIEFLTAVFLYSYERAGVPHLDKRIQYALKWSAYFS